MFETSLTQEQIRAHEVSAHQFVRGNSTDCAIVHLTADAKTIDGMATFRISMLDVSGRSYNVVLHPDDLRALADAIASRPTHSDSAIASNLENQTDREQAEREQRSQLDPATLDETSHAETGFIEDDLSEDSWDFEQVIVTRPQSDLEAEAWSTEDPWEGELPDGVDQKSDYDRWLTAWDDAAA